MPGDVHPAVADRELPPPPERLPSPVVDGHTHLDACGCRDAADVAATMDRAAAVGVATVITVADDLASARWVVDAAQWHPSVYAAVALHPTRADALDEQAMVELERLAAHPRVVAVGETGLDYYWHYAAPAAQATAFAWHIDLAKRLDKPLMIHDRDAHDDVLDILAGEGAPRTVVLHCFSGGVDMARRCIDAGYHISLAGPVSFRNAKELVDVARWTPADRLLVETDAPFLTPHPYRGRRNEPFALPYTVRALAEIRADDLTQLCETVTRTTAGVYGIRVSPG
jgi:TatD DNase family protein